MGIVCAGRVLLWDGSGLLLVYTFGTRFVISALSKWSHGVAVAEFASKILKNRGK
jgi:hypothetical protein